MHLNGKFFEKLIFFEYFEAKVIIFTWYVKTNETGYKKVSKVKVDLRPFTQGRSYCGSINILKLSFLTNQWPNWTQISCEDSLW